MEGDKLPVQFIWLPSEKELPPPDSCEFSPEKPLKALKSYLSKLLDFPVEIERAKPKISNSYSDENQPNFGIRPSMFYAEYLFSVTAKINFQHFENACAGNFDLHKKLITRFCSERHDDSSPELYWNADTSHIFAEDLNTSDHFIDLKSFSLGNIVKLNTFVEHFNSDKPMESTDKHHYKITQVKVKFLHDAELVKLNFVVKNSKVHIKKSSCLTHRMFQLVIPYSSINTILISNAKSFSVYIRLYGTPMLYAIDLKEDYEIKDYVSYMDLTFNTRWIRAVGLFDKCPSNIKKEFSMNTVVCLNFTRENYEALKVMCHHKGVQTYFSYMNVVPYKPIQIALSENSLDFGSYYAYQCLVTHSYEVVDQLMVKEELDIFKNFLIDKSKSKEDCKALCRSLYNIHSALNRCYIVLLNYSLKRLYRKLLNPAVIDDFNPDLNNSNLLHVRRAIIIPTHIRYLPPHPILKSRALRSCNPDYSIRISIRDVNQETINYSYRGFDEGRQTFLSEFFETNYKKHMLKGIKIGKRIYQYVGGSTSQLRGHGIWFYATDDTGKSAKMLRETFGNMEKIKQVPKYMARMGQTFSQARGRIKVPQSWTNVDCPDEDVERGVKKYLEEEDLDNPRNKKFLVTVEESENGEPKTEPYTFSDGIGRISPELAADIYTELELEELKPCAMQIRYAGCKGMLVVDPTLKGKQIKFRNSMKKFSSEDDSLEIIKVSEKRTASLNRPLITIMEQLGVRKEVFVKLQREMIQNYIKSMFHEPMACDFLNRNSKLRFDFNGMHLNGISFTEDPLFRSMIYALFQKLLGLLKNKANIEIPVNNGRAMFGVFDETFTLEYGQVFVQYTDWNDDETTHILEETILVTKNPCMHGGDVRKFEAIDVEALHHIKDCIVFPAKGHRPHPDEMAGSDLDGDEYHVMWYKDFIFERENEDPMHFAIRKVKDDPNKPHKPIEVEDELDHLCNYIINDNVGLIANAHLVFADKERMGIFGDNCVRLAKKYAISLDFAKSGKMTTRNRKDRVFKYPDFMQKMNERDTYISKKALGILYRNCKRLEMGLETTNTEIGYNLDPDLIVDNWEEYENSALQVYDFYCQKVEHLMNVYSFANEGELLAGAIINPPKYYEQRHDLDNIMQLLEYEVQWIFNDLKKTFYKDKDFPKKPVNGNFTKKMYQKASAWYIVAYKKRSGKKYNFFGLPWAASDVLVSLKQEKCRLKRNMATNCKSILEETIDECLKSDLPEISKESEISVIHESRYEVLDVAQKVLNKWWKTQRDHVLIKDFKKCGKLIDKEFLALSERLTCCDAKYIEHLKNENDLKKALSPAYYVIETLLRLACMKIQKSSFNNIEQELSFQKSSFNNIKQELSLLSWVTLIKLACTYNPNYLGIADKEGKIANSIYFLPQDTVVSTFRLHLFHNDEYNEKFSLKLLQESQDVIEYLKEVSTLKEMKYRFDMERDKKIVAIFTVKGSRYAIEKLKDLIIQEDFYKWVVKGKKIFASQG